MYDMYDMYISLSYTTNKVIEVLQHLTKPKAISCDVIAFM